MKKNKLYTFIKLDLKKSKSFKKNNFVLKENSAQENYALYHLPMSSLKCPKGYSIRSHHLSFYEGQKDNDPNLSQYHYTA